MPELEHQIPKNSLQVFHGCAHGMGRMRKENTDPFEVSK